MKTAKNCNQLQRVKKKFAFLLNCKSFFSVTAVTTDCCSRCKNNPTTQKTKKQKKNSLDSESKTGNPFATCEQVENCNNIEFGY